MKFAKKVLIAVDLSRPAELLQPLKAMNFLADSELHFVHVYPVYNYGSSFGEYALVYPLESDREKIQESALATLVKLSQKALPPSFSGKVKQTVLFDEEPKKAFSDYAREIKADSIIIMTKPRHGFFESSFAEYVNKHTECDMIYIKQRKDS